MRFVAPDEYTSKTRFIDRYAIQEWNFFGFREISGLRVENRDELFKFLDPRMIRRTKAQVLPDLPPKVRTTVYCEMTPKQRKAYQEMSKHMIAELDAGTFIAATNPLTKLTRLMQFASAYGTLIDNGKVDELTGLPALDLLLTDPSCKVDAFMDWIEDIGTAQTLVFAESRQLMDLMVARLCRPVAKGKRERTVGQIVGGLSEDERHLAKTRFQAGELQFLCMTMAAGGTGLDLHKAEKVAFLQRSCSLILNTQSEDRAHRNGNEHESIEIVDFITPNTVDEIPHVLLEEKQEMLEEIVRDQAGLRDWLLKKGD